MSSSGLSINPIRAHASLTDQAYDSLKAAICNTDIYAPDTQLRLDERQLSEQLGISRTPIREALVRLEQEGLVRIQPRRGVFIRRKTKAEILDAITVWAALESMAARLATQSASDQEIAALRATLGEFDDGIEGHIDEYSERNIQFHQAIIAMCGCRLLIDTADRLFIDMRAIRVQTIGHKDRASRSIIDHMNIIEALETRQTELAETLVRDHALNLADHVRENIDYLE